MPGWNEILEDVTSDSNNGEKLEGLIKKYLNEVYRITGRNVIVYYSGWLQNPNVPGVSIEDDDMNGFMATVYKLDKSKGLDLILHTPGGNIEAAEGIVNYLKCVFKGDIRAIIPQISMSAGTMIALSCREILMGNQSSLGPVDPQFGGIPCQAALDEFDRAVKDVKENYSSLGLWQAILSKLNPTFLTDCQNAIKLSTEIVEKWLMDVNYKISLKNVKDVFIDHNNSYSHGRHISKQQCKDVGLNIVDLEGNQALQDAVLSLHHCYVLAFDMFRFSKIIENHIGGKYYKQNQRV